MNHFISVFCVLIPLFFVPILSASVQCNDVMNSPSSVQIGEQKQQDVSIRKLVKEFESIHYKGNSIVHLDLLSPEIAVPALKILIEKANFKLEKLINDPREPNFRNTVIVLEGILRDIDLYSRSFYTVASSLSSTYSAVKNQFSKETEAFSFKLYTNVKLFEKIDIVYKKRNNHLKEDSKRLIKKYYDEFFNNGVHLSIEDQVKMKNISEKLQDLKSKFSNNLVKYTDETFLEFTKEELDGLPPSMIENAKKLAQKSGNSKYLLLPNAPSVGAVLKNATMESTRKKMWTSYSAANYKTGETDNSQIALEIIKLSQEEAKILGFKSFADLSISHKSAPSLEEVVSFLENLRRTYFYNAKIENENLRSFKESFTGSRELKPWDATFWLEKYQFEKIGISDKVTRPYFELESFQSAFHKKMENLYGIEIQERPDIKSYHEDVKVFEIRKEGAAYAYLHVDLYARVGKRGGAWMTEPIKGYTSSGVRHPPTATINLNLDRSNGGDLTLMNIGELVTYAHEFGHSIHSMMSFTRYRSQFGVDTPWDVVEVPSQFNENFIFVPEFIKSFARHYISKEVIPDSLVEGIIRSANFFAGSAGLRQVNLALLDLSYYSNPDLVIDDFGKYEDSLFEEFRLYDTTGIFTSQTTHFGHIFSGYAAGYYSYKWAEILDADAFRVFMEEGLDNPDTAKRWLDNVISIGGSKDFHKSFVKFLGRDIDPNSLILREGLELPPLEK